MKLVLSWLRDFLPIDLPPMEIARLLTQAGLEVDSVQIVGLPLPENQQLSCKFEGLPWDRDKFVVAQVDEVLPHPNADRLTLCRLNDGQGEHLVLTGAPNMFPYKGIGPLEKPLKVAYAREGARLYDGHQPGLVITTLKKAKIRGVDSDSMICSEKELGISDEHEGVILLDDDAPTGTPLADYLGDAVFEIDILPNMIRNACVIGAARELSALTGLPLQRPVRQIAACGEPITGKVKIEITDPDCNPRFVAGLIRGVEPKASPYWVQRRLRLAGMRPINAVVDATNYMMLELGQPLHAFDYDKLVERAGGKTPTIITRLAKPGEHLTTLDNVDRALEPYTIMVTDTAGSLSLAGVMGGLESEVTDATRNVLLEGAAWNFVNVRKTVTSQKLNSEAGYRFSRGVHPALSKEGVEWGLERMAAWAGGEIAAGLVDEYPKPAVDPEVAITPAQVAALLGCEIPADVIVGLLSRLEFTCRVEGGTIYAKTPPHRLDIGEGVIGRADLIEEVARLYSYDRIPYERLDKVLPAQRGNPGLETQERVRDILAALGLQEVITYRQTNPEREARLLPVGASAPELEYVRLANPLTPERNVMRRSLLASVLEITEKNIRLADRLALFEIGPVFLPQAGQQLPNEDLRLVIAMTGVSGAEAWDRPAPALMDFYDLKGVIQSLLDELHVEGAVYAPAANISFHPGKCASVRVGEHELGVFGELHPLVKERFDFLAAPVLAADLDIAAITACIPARHVIEPVPVFPAVFEDLAVIVDEDLPAERLEEVLRQGGGKLLAGLRLFDIFRGEQIGAGKKSMAYNLAYQAPDRTLTDTEAAQVRQRIIRRLEQELGAKIRS